MLKALHTAQDAAESMVESAKHLPESPLVKKMIGGLVAANDYVLDKMADMGAVMSRTGSAVGEAVAEKATFASHQASLTLHAAKEQASHSLHDLEDKASHKLEDARQDAKVKLASAKQSAASSLNEFKMQASHQLEHAKESASAALSSVKDSAVNTLAHSKESIKGTFNSAFSSPKKGGGGGGKSVMRKTVTMPRGRQLPRRQRFSSTVPFAPGRNLPAQVNEAEDRATRSSIISSSMGSTASNQPLQGMKSADQLDEDMWKAGAMLSDFARRNAAFAISPGRYLPGTHNVAEFQANEFELLSKRQSSQLKPVIFHFGRIRHRDSMGRAISQHAKHISERYGHVMDTLNQLLQNVKAAGRYAPNTLDVAESMAPSLPFATSLGGNPRAKVFFRYSGAVFAIHAMLATNKNPNKGPGRYYPNTSDIAESMALKALPLRSRSSSSMFVNGGRVQARFPEAVAALHDIASKHSLAFPGRYYPQAVGIAEQRAQELASIAATPKTATTTSGNASSMMSSLPSGHNDLSMSPAAHASGVSVLSSTRQQLLSNISRDEILAAHPGRNAPYDYGNNVQTSRVEFRPVPGVESERARMQEADSQRRPSLTINTAAPMDPAHEEIKPTNHQVRAPLHGDFSGAVAAKTSSVAQQQQQPIIQQQTPQNITTTHTRAA